MCRGLCKRAFRYVFFKRFQMSALQRMVVLGNVRSEREADTSTPDTFRPPEPWPLTALSLGEQKVNFFLCTSIVRVISKT